MVENQTGDTELVRLTGDGKQKCKVSSVLNKSVEYAGVNVFDYLHENCWNSDQGSPQFILIDLCRLVIVKKIGIVFQGGFVGSRCEIETGVKVSELIQRAVIFPADDNSFQLFDISTESEPSVICRFMKINFTESTDFYGRITVYRLEVFGNDL